LRELPHRVAAGGKGELRSWLRSLPPFELAPLELHPAPASGAQLELRWRAFTLLSFAAHAYMWCDGAPHDPPPASLPRSLAAPWCAVAEGLDMPPVLTYAVYNLLNFRRLDPGKPVQLGNIACLHSFLGGVDEEWFRLIHVDIEATAAPVISSLPALQGALAAQAGDLQPARRALGEIAQALEAMQATLARMGEKCDPYVYYNRVRRPMSGWKGNPELPGGLAYEGVGDEAPRQYYGETGAQASLPRARN
jgi:indoleamine 2,3-dioxygenase